MRRPERWATTKRSRCAAAALLRLPTLTHPPQVLGVRDGASADAIVAAKRAALSRGASADEVDAAYDAVLMRSFSKRAGGAVDLQVKYADVAKAGTSQKSGGADGVARWLTRNAPAVSAPDSAALALPAALFAAASLAALAQGAAHVPGAPDAAPSLPLALGFGLSVYSLRRKNLSLPRAASLSAAGLLAGTAVGSLVQAALHVDIVPLGPLSSPATLVSEFALAGLFAVRARLSSRVSALALTHRLPAPIRHPPSSSDAARHDDTAGTVHPRQRRAIRVPSTDTKWPLPLFHNFIFHTPRSYSQHSSQPC